MRRRSAWHYSIITISILMISFIMGCAEDEDSYTNGDLSANTIRIVDFDFVSSSL